MPARAMAVTCPSAVAEADWQGELGTSARELLIGIAPVEMARFEMA
jgi:hypothetical protein